MTIEQSSYAALTEVLEHEARHLAQLIDLLKEERSDLVGASSERIDQIAAEKLHRIQALDTYATRRSALLAELGHPQSGAGMIEAIEAGEGLRDRMRTLWSQVTERATVARELNDLNGSLINVRLNAVQGRLTHLQRAAGGNSEPLYGADGLSRSEAITRPLGNV